MPKISMTTFVDFVTKSGTPRLTVLRKAKSEYELEYSPARDFYKALRESIVEMHENQTNIDNLDSVMEGLTDQRKLRPYQECVAGYRKWCGRKEIKWVKSFVAHWTRGHLAVRVNPELGVSIDGKMHFVKLYFKPEKLSKPRIETMFCLLAQSLPNEFSESRVGILEVRRGVLHGPNRNIPDIETLLDGEAAAFQTMWDHV